MSLEQNRDYYFLKQLVDSPGQMVKSFAASRAKPKGLDLDAPAKKAVETGLIERNFIKVDGKGKEKRFSLTEAGQLYFRTLTPFPPPPPPPPPKLKAFALLTLLSAGDRPVTLKQVKAMIPAGVLKALDASKDDLTAVLEVLEKERAVEKSAGEGTTADDRVQLLLTENGKREIVLQRQHADMVFKLSGSAVNLLIEYAAGRPILNESISHCMPVPTGDQAQNLVALAAGSPFSDEELIREAKAMMATRGRNGLLPIFELRRHVKRKFGEWAAGLEEFDKRLKRLRGQRLELISLFEPSAFSHDQLTEGVQGAGELFFYVKDLR